METEKIREVLSKMNFPKMIKITPFESVLDIPRFVEYNLSVYDNFGGMGWTIPYYERVEEIIAIIQGRNYTRLTMNMIVEQRLDRCRDLWHNHKLGIALPYEYTVAKYDFLEEQGILKLTVEEKKVIFAQANDEYIVELENIINYSTRFADVSKAKVLITKIEKDELDKNDKAVIVSLAKILSLKKFLDNCENVF